MPPTLTRYRFSMAIAIALFVRSPANGAWIDLFNGQDLAGWQIGENADAFYVQDGLLVVDGPAPTHFMSASTGRRVSKISSSRPKC